ncbi:hypothetical protein ACLSU7_06930 [Bdellovibrio sp. HCB185ZH]|uniref:hypothetical protein n=1 Tax=Bdellovibrio sp. HCB185ZH TaxID=3394235 RepID=UPI0039A6424B
MDIEVILLKNTDGYQAIGSWVGATWGMYAVNTGNCANPKECINELKVQLEKRLKSNDTFSIKGRSYKSISEIPEELSDD